MKNKKGLIGKIILIILIVILVIGAVLGITAWQVYDVYKTVKEESPILQEEVRALTEQGDCTKITSIESRFTKIKAKADNACLNPIIKLGVKKYMAEKPMNINGKETKITCDGLNSLYDEMQSQFKPIKEMCANATLIKQINQAKNITA